MVVGGAAGSGMLAEAPQQEPVVGLPQRAELVECERPGHAVGQLVLDALPGLANAAVELRSDITDDVDGAAEMDERPKLLERLACRLLLDHTRLHA